MSAAPKSKKMGRPRKPGGHDVLVAGRVPTATAAALHAYAKKKGINRSEALRRMIEASLVVADTELPTARRVKAKGKDL
jgi:hypothetical protein